MPDPVPTALMIPASEEMVDNFVATINSIRKQTHIPWVVHIIEFGRWTIHNKHAVEAIKNLQLFCPRVHVIHYPKHYDLAQAYIESKDRIFDSYSLPVLVVVNNIPLEQNAIWEISYLFLNPKIDIVRGRYEHMRVNKNWFGRLWYRMTRRARYDLSAYRNYNYEGKR